METELNELIDREKRRHRRMQFALCLGVLLVVISTRSDRAMFQFTTPGAFANFGIDGDGLNSAFYAAPGIPGFALMGAGGPFGRPFGAAGVPGMRGGSPAGPDAVSFVPPMAPTSANSPVGGGSNNAVPSGPGSPLTPGGGLPSTPGGGGFPGIMPPGVPATPPDITEPFIPTVPSAVPEPATWAMMILGFLGIGSAMRRRKHAQPSRQRDGVVT